MADKKLAHEAGWSYDVFLSFRGEDTRKNFTDHLYHALKRAGINVFRDDNELRRGQDITSELEQAIQGSRTAVVVFSKNYAGSRWCLQELVKIMECRRTLRQFVLPIFYDVDPSDVRKQTGSFEEAFARHQQRSLDVDRVLRWRIALTDAANLSGFDLQETANGYEAKFIRSIVKLISRELDSTNLHVALYPVGIDSHVKAITLKLDVGSDGVRMVGIWGMGGIGKTTIAKAVYNKVHHSFERKCFLANIKEVSQRLNGQVQLQKHFLSAISNSTKTKVKSVDHGIILLQEILRQRKVLLVLDDVDDREQLIVLARSCEWFASGSRIIVTTRDEHLLRQLEVDEVYMVDEMNETEALELFSWHAFRNSYPAKPYYQLSISVVNYTRGLPLALEILGSFLFQRSIPEWKDTLDKLKTIPNDQIQRKLRISYDGLRDDTYKDIFLDISCFFIGMDQNYVVQILDGCRLFPKIGIHVLLERCLIKIDEENKLMMHDLLRDMGREIVREESPKEPGKRSRLLHDEALDVLNKQKGTDTIEGLTLKMLKSNQVNLSTKAFSKMQNLRLLQLNYVHLTGGFEHLSQELRWLCWHGFPLKFLPNEFFMEKLVAIDLRYSQLKILWKESKFLEKLKILDLSHSYYLTHTPDFLKLPNLEKLELEECERLVELHHSIGDLQRLVFVNLKGCKCLKRLPASFYKLKCLETLILSSCSKLDCFPEDLGEMESLTTLISEHTVVRQVPSTLVRLKKLKYLSLSCCKGLTSESFLPFFWSWIRPMEYPNSVVLPPSLKGLDSLTKLRLRSCNMPDDAIPEDIGSLKSLVELDLRENDFRGLPSSISSLSKLHTLWLDDCKRLKHIPDLPPDLKLLHASNCSSLERTSNLSKVRHLEHLIANNCSNLVEIPGIGELDPCVIFIGGSGKIGKSFKENVLQGWKISGFGGLFDLRDNIPDKVTFVDDDHSVCIKLCRVADCNFKGLFVCSTIFLSSDPVPFIKYTTGAGTTDDVLMSIEDHLWRGHLPDRLTWMTGDTLDTTACEAVDFEADIVLVETNKATTLMYYNN